MIDVDSFSLKHEYAPVQPHRGPQLNLMEALIL